MRPRHFPHFLKVDCFYMHTNSEIPQSPMHIVVKDIIWIGNY